jgi:hypothetical protein
MRVTCFAEIGGTSPLKHHLLGRLHDRVSATFTRASCLVMSPDREPAEGCRAHSILAVECNSRIR